MLSYCRHYHEQCAVLPAFTNQNY